MFTPHIDTSQFANYSVSTNITIQAPTINHIMPVLPNTTFVPLQAINLPATISAINHNAMPHNTLTKINTNISKTLPNLPKPKPELENMKSIFNAKLDKQCLSKDTPGLNQHCFDVGFDHVKTTKLKPDAISDGIDVMPCLVRREAKECHEYGTVSAGSMK